MGSRGRYTLAEIMTQPDAWEDALRAFAALEGDLRRAWQALHPVQVIFVGCGSTYYLSQVAASLFQELTGVLARAYPGSEIALFAPQILLDPRHTLLVAISRSGTTTETLVALDRFRELGGQAAWAITCYPDSPLAGGADLVLPAEAAQEQSIAQTRSFASMLLLVQALAGAVAGEDLSILSGLPALGRELLDRAAPLAEALGEGSRYERFFFLGSGLRYGLASEAMLKMKEMSLSYSEAFHFMEFRHGPKSMVNERSLVVGLACKEALAHEWQVLDEMVSLGGQVLVLTPCAVVGSAFQTVTLEAGLPAWGLPVLYLPALQLLAYYRAISKGLDPDRPQNLDAVVSLDRSSFSAA